MYKQQEGITLMTARKKEKGGHGRMTGERKEGNNKKDAPSCVETDRTATSLFASISIPWFVENFVSFVARSDSEEFLAR